MICQLLWWFPDFLFPLRSLLLRCLFAQWVGAAAAAEEEEYSVLPIDFSSSSSPLENGRRVGRLTVHMQEKAVCEPGFPEWKGKYSCEFKIIRNGASKSKGKVLYGIKLFSCRLAIAPCSKSAEGIKDDVDDALLFLLFIYPVAQHSISHTFSPFAIARENATTEVHSTMTIGTVLVCQKRKYVAVLQKWKRKSIFIVLFWILYRPKP